MEDSSAVSAAVLFIFMFLGTTVCDQEHCQIIRSIPNRALNGHVIGASMSSSVEKCLIKCERNPDCYSINYVFSSKSCELNKGTRLSHPGNFLPRENTVYFDGSLHRHYHACVHPPCRNGATCVLLTQSPGYECKCQPKYSGNHCQGKELMCFFSCYILLVSSRHHGNPASNPLFFPPPVDFSPPFLPGSQSYPPPPLPSPSLT